MSPRGETSLALGHNDADGASKQRSTNAAPKNSDACVKGFKEAKASIDDDQGDAWSKSQDVTADTANSTYVETDDVEAGSSGADQDDDSDYEDDDDKEDDGSAIAAYIPDHLRKYVRPYHRDFCYSFHPSSHHLLVQLMAEGFLPMAANNDRR